MGPLTVVYDADCPLCRRCRQWVLAQEHLIEFRFVAAQEPWVQDWLGALVPVGDELVVVGGDGATWVGPDAFIACLSGLTRYRSLARRLQRPGAKTLAKQAFHLVSSGRGVASLFVPGQAAPDVECWDRSCTPSNNEAQ
jgi:predicted DCC family thiol-disulfide oxidoreductase YuxK